MQPKRGELVPIGETVASLDGPVKAIREASPQARHSFTVADQVNQLVTASEADPDRGFMARMMALCSLPRTNPGNRIQSRRVVYPSLQPPLHNRFQPERTGPFCRDSTKCAALFVPAALVRCATKNGDSSLINSLFIKDVGGYERI